MYLISVKIRLFKSSSQVQTLNHPMTAVPQTISKTTFETPIKSSCKTRNGTLPSHLQNLLISRRVSSRTTTPQEQTAPKKIEKESFKASISNLITFSKGRTRQICRTQILWITTSKSHCYEDDDPGPLGLT